MGWFSSDNDPDDDEPTCPAAGHRHDPGVHHKRSHGEYRPLKPGEPRRPRHEHRPKR